MISDGFENDLSSVSDREESEENLSYTETHCLVFA